jgi:4a-hydroxytetrahydrobiopterin dehydratase
VKEGEMAKSKKAPGQASGTGERRKLSADEVTSRLRVLDGWSLRRGGGAIERTYALPSFRASLAFVAFVGELAEAKNHHPDIDIRYNRVTLALSTHDAGGVTPKDFELAHLVDGGAP